MKNTPLLHVESNVNQNVLCGYKTKGWRKNGRRKKKKMEKNHTGIDCLLFNGTGPGVLYR